MPVMMSYRHDNHPDTLAVILLVLWFLGMVSSFTMGGFVHVVLVVVLVIFVVGLIQGRTA
jgi:energy-coupling factor transporter transmembrane protein EcfT